MSSPEIPLHDGQGPWHLALGVPLSALPPREARLLDHAVTLVSRVQLKHGGRSQYFRDPGGHSVELATPGIWEPLA